jgi:hypothetical protein
MLSAARRRIVLLGGGACSRTSAYLDPKEDFPMARSRKFLTAGAVGVAAVALIAASSSVTGAWFTDSAPGSVTGTLGEVHVHTTTTTFQWTNMMPAEPQTATVAFQNTGTGNQDFWLVFKNVPALHAFNNLGTYGEVHIVDGNNNHLFDSTNLQDGRHQYSVNGANVPDTNSCGTFSPTGCWPLPTSLKLASNVAPTAGNSVAFTFNYAGKLGGSPSTYSGGGTFNQYPLSGKDIFDGAPGAADGALPNGGGLPFEIVATQVGHAPTD